MSEVSYFPIFTDESAFTKQAKQIISQLEPSIAELVERIQPYHRAKSDVEGTPEFDPLVSLNILSNLDKHRMPVPFLIPPQEISFQQSCQFYSNEDATANIPPNVIIHAGSLVHGKTVLEYITTCPIKQADGVFQIKANVAIEANNFTREVIEIISQLTWYTRLVVNEFEKHLTN